MKLTRREFLELTGWMGVMLSSPFPLKKTPVVEAAERWLSQPEQWVPTTCLLCPGRCGVLARVVEGYVVKLEGNPQHPINRGGLCPLGQAGLHMVHHPDRIPGPMKRLGERGEGKWKRIDWRTALDEVAAALGQMRQGNEPHTVAFLSQGLREEDTLKHLIDRFMEAYGSPNHIVASDPEDGMPVAHYLSQGIHEPFAYDLERAQYILSFGTSLLEDWHSPCEAHRLYGYLRQGRPGPKAKFVQIEPRFSVTAAKSDQWVPLRPGTYGALALGIAYVLMKEGLCDKQFIDEKTFGFEDWTDAEGKTHQGFKEAVLKTYKPETVSEITDIPIPTLLQIAKDFARHKPSLAIADGGATLYSNGSSTAFAIHCLNALVGSIDSPGGVLIPQKVPLAKLPPPTLDEIAKQGLSRPRLDGAGETLFPLSKSCPAYLHEAISKESPYPVKLLFLYRANPLFTAPNPQKSQSAFQKIPFIVSFSPYWDETTQKADWVLPDATFLEKWQDAPTTSMAGLPVMGLVQPVAETPYETRHTGEVLLELARRLEGSVRDSFPWKNFQTVLEERLKGIFAAERGTLFTGEEETVQVRLFEERGWWVPSFGAWGKFWEDFRKRGGWWDPHYPFAETRKVYQTPSRKFEFYSQTFHSFVPHFESPKFEGSPAEFPFYLNPFRLLVLSAPEAASSPWLLEALSVQNGVGWDSWVEINPKTAASLGIREGDGVWVVSPSGKLKLRAKLYEGAGPEVVNIPLGLGHDGFGRYAGGIGVNPNILIPDAQERLSGHPVRFGTRVKVFKA